jgi:hypothetical protein
MQQDEAPPVLEDMTPAVRRAARGFRSDVAAFIAAAEAGGLYLALAKPLAGVSEGAIAGAENEVTGELEEEISLAPHLLSDSDGVSTAVAFTDKDVLKTVADHLDWTTDGDALEMVGLPAFVVFDVALGLVQEHGAQGLVLNPGDDAELFLDGRELASIAQKQALPLVGYVQQIPVGKDEATLVAEPEAPPPEEFVRTIDTWLESERRVSSYDLSTTFNPERDLEPHLTLTLAVNAWPEDPTSITGPLLRELSDRLPPPGYIDILLDDASAS